MSAWRYECSGPVVVPFSLVVVNRESMLLYNVIRQGLRSPTALKADHAVFLNGLPKVSAVISKLFWLTLIVDLHNLAEGREVSTCGPRPYGLSHVSTCVTLIAELTLGQVSSAL